MVKPPDGMVNVYVPGVEGARTCAVAREQVTPGAALPPPAAPMVLPPATPPTKEGSPQPPCGKVPFGLSFK